MHLLATAFRYNSAANVGVIELLRQLTPAQLNAGFEGEQTALGFAHHLAETEAGFLASITAGERVDVGEGLDAVASALETLDARFLAIAEALDEAGASRTFHVPWFGTDMAVAEGLLQVVLHSHQHRADITWATHRAGIKTPPTDFIVHALGFWDVRHQYTG